MFSVVPWHRKGREMIDFSEKGTVIPIYPSGTIILHVQVLSSEYKSYCKYRIVSTVEL